MNSSVILDDNFCALRSLAITLKTTRLLLNKGEDPRRANPLLLQDSGYNRVVLNESYYRYDDHRAGCGRMRAESKEHGGDNCLEYTLRRQASVLEMI